MARVSEKAKKTAGSAMKRKKKGGVKTSRSRKKTTSRKQETSEEWPEMRKKGTKTSKRESD